MHVGRLQIAVEHAALVCRANPGAELARDADGLVLREARALTLLGCHGL
jgi:hypothetical protein